MTPGTLNTILNTAPALIQGASKLVKLIRERGNDEADQTIPNTLEGMKQELTKIDARLDASDDSSLAQVKLIEELAKQNEGLAESLKKTMNLLTILGVLCVLSILFAALALYFSLH